MKKTPLFLTILLSLTFGFKGIAQTTFQENKIEELCFGVLNSDYDQERKQFNEALKTLLKEELIKEGAFEHPFNSVKSLGILNSPDSNLRVFNWMVPFTDGTYHFECLLLAKLNGQIELIELQNLPADSLIQEDVVYGKSHWPGSLYYDIIEKQGKFKTYYTLLGWDGENALINQKSIDVFSFTKAGELQIGAQIFKSNEFNRQQRIVFKYGDQNKMKLSYNKELDWIIFDHLSPSSSNLEGVYEYYGADFSFDAYQWEKDHWRLYSDVNVDEGLKKKKSDFKVDKDIIQKKETIYEY